MRKKVQLSLLTFTNMALFVFLLGVAISPFAGTCGGSSSLLVQASGENPLAKSKSVVQATQVQSALREIYKEVNPAVVRIETEQTIETPTHPFFNDPMFRRFFGVPNGSQRQKQKRTGLGSGFIINKNGYIVTNHHVVKKVDKITVKLGNGKEYTAKIIGSDANSDIALLKIDGGKNLKSIHMGDSDKIEVGDFAIAIGNPYGLSSTFTLGVISSRGQDVNSSDGMPRIQTDAAINPGNSGGPLLNIQGEVIGINQMIYSQTGGSVGIGFAIPINYAIEVVEKLKQGKTIKPGYIGVSIAAEATEDQLNELGLKGKTGLLVGQVVIGSPAWKAGVRPYDFITKVDGKAADKFSVLRNSVLRKGAGSTLAITLLRNGKPISLKVKVGETPSGK